MVVNFCYESAHECLKVRWEGVGQISGFKITEIVGGRVGIEQGEERQQVLSAPVTINLVVSSLIFEISLLLLFGVETWLRLATSLFRLATTLS